MESDKLAFEREKWILSQHLEDKKVEVQEKAASFERENWIAEKELDEKRLEIEQKRVVTHSKTNRLHFISACLANGKSIDDLDRISKMFGFD